MGRGLSITPANALSASEFSAPSGIILTLYRVSCIKRIKYECKDYEYLMGKCTILKTNKTYRHNEYSAQFIECDIKYQSWQLVFL